MTEQSQRLQNRTICSIHKRQTEFSFLCPQSYRKLIFKALKSCIKALLEHHILEM